jgi:hypothetical protein
MTTGIRLVRGFENNLWFNLAKFSYYNFWMTTGELRDRLSIQNLKTKCVMAFRQRTYLPRYCPDFMYQISNSELWFALECRSDTSRGILLDHFNWILLSVYFKQLDAQFSQIHVFVPNLQPSKCHKLRAIAIRKLNSSLRSWSSDLPYLLPSRAFLRCLNIHEWPPTK